MRVLIAEPVTSRDRIVKVIIETIIVLDDSSGAALRSNGVAAHRIHLGDQRNFQGRIRLRHRDRRAQAGTTGADNCDI